MFLFFVGTIIADHRVVDALFPATEIEETGEVFREPSPGET